MKNYRYKKTNARPSFKLKSGFKYTGELALGLWAATPESTDPIDSILKHSRALIRDAGLTGPPFRPASYAPLRKIKRISYKPMQIDGRIFPIEDGFIVELKKSSPGRESFTLAHEIAHTFFFELVPSVKYRRLYSLAQDNEEESLCNIAASELLMPLSSIKMLARDYSPSLDSLREIAQIYETSLTATVLRLSSTKLWNIKFILWQSVGNELKARWFAEPGKCIVRSPLIDIENIEASSIRTTLVTGEPTEGEEWLCFGRRFKFCRVSSIRLPSSTMVLTAIGATSSLSRSRVEKSTSIGLPVEYECTCFGTGTRLIERGGLIYAARCLASPHHFANAST